MNELAQEILVRIALTKFKKKTDACEFLGIAMRTLYTLRTRVVPGSRCSQADQ